MVGLSSLTWIRLICYRTRSLWQLPPGLQPTFYPEWLGKLPLRPLWRGFVINTACYSIVVWLLLHLRRRSRVRARLDRRTCQDCRYDLRGAVSDDTITCPECGRRIPAHLLSRPRQVLRLWMALPLLPAMTLAAVRFLGFVDAHRLGFRFRIDSTLIPLSIVATVAMGGCLFLACRRAYRDRPPRASLPLSLAVSIVLALSFGASLHIYVLLIRMLP